MADALKPGDPGFGVENYTPEPETPLPRGKSPDWNSYMDPKRWAKMRVKGRPPELPPVVETPAPTPAPAPEIKEERVSKGGK